MNLQKRRLLKGVGLGAIWSTPVVRAVSLPAHAQTSAESCSNLDVETVNEPISITVSAADVRGPAVATRSGQTFEVMFESTAGLCADGVTPLRNMIEFSGTIDAMRGTISGTFNTRQFCGTELACEQLATFTATQTPIGSISDVGDYEGQVTGTLRCCLDLV